MLIAFVVVMVFSLVGEGIFLLFSGFPFPGLPLPLYAMGATWLAECLCTVFYTKHPNYALAIGWLMLILTSVSLHKNQNIRHTFSGFLYQHSLELLFIAASHLGYFTILRQRRIARSIPGG